MKKFRLLTALLIILAVALTLCACTAKENSTDPANATDSASGTDPANATNPASGTDSVNATDSASGTDSVNATDPGNGTDPESGENGNTATENVTYEILSHIGEDKLFDSFEINGDNFVLIESEKEYDGEIVYYAKNETVGTLKEDGDKFILSITSTTLKYEFDNDEDKQTILDEIQAYIELFGEDSFAMLTTAINGGYTMTIEEARADTVASAGFHAEIVLSVDKAAKTALVLTELDVDGWKAEYAYHNDEGAVKVQKYTDPDGEVFEYKYDIDGLDVEE